MLQLPRRKKVEETEDEPWLWDRLLEEDVDGPLPSSERWAMYSLPFGFALVSLVFYSLTWLFPNTPASWLTFFALLLAYDYFVIRGKR
jgi:hypothetical protein